MKDGLAGLTVHGIAQDKEGFLWFATETGLSRFDGTHFKNFTRADGLPSNEVFGTFVDSKNRIWITSFKNAICYYWKGKIHNQQNDSVLKKIRLGSIVFSVGENPQGDILICSSTKECFVVSHRQEVFKLNDERFYVSRGLGDFPTSKVALPRQIAALTTGYVNYCAWHNHNRLSSGHRNYLFFYPDGDKALFFRGSKWAGYSIRLPRETRQIEYLDDSTIAVLGMHAHGARIYDLYKRQFVTTYLPDYTIHTVFKDMEGSIWFSTKEAGVFRLTNPTFRNVVFYAGQSPLAVLSIHRIAGEIHVGTENAHYWKLEPAETDMTQDHWYQCGKLPTSTSFIRKGEQGQFINYSSSNFFGFNTMQKSIKTIQVFHDTLLASSVFGTFLFRLPAMDIIDTLHDGRSTTAYRKGNVCYIGTQNGLFEIRENGEKIFLGDTNPLFKSCISSFAEGLDGTLWIATYEAGVIGYKAGKVIANITRKKGGLSSDICRCIFISGHDLWVGTEKGLNKVDISPGRYITTARFTANDGLGADIINGIYIDRNIVFVGTPAGLTYFDQGRIPRHSVCYIRLTGISVSGKEIDPRQDQVVLAHRDNNIRFEFAGISFLSSGDISYSYRLLGLSDEWKSIKEKVLNYPLLPSGQYTLQLRAVNKFNDQSEILQFAFGIRKTLWEETWFQLIMILVLAFFVWLSVQLRIQQIRKKDKEKHLINQKIAGLEQMALRAQMNPHFIFNCLNSIQHYIIRQDVKGANFYLSQFAGLVRSTLENSSKIHISLAEEITYLSNYIELEKLQLANQFEYVIHNEVEDMEKLILPNMVIQPYVENAIKHGIGSRKEKGEISIIFRCIRDSNILECVIEDNGIGISRVQELQQRADTRHHSKGMSITSGRIEILNQLYPGNDSIEVTVTDIRDGESIRGTRVQLRFPLNNLINY